MRFRLLVLAVGIAALLRLPWLEVLPPAMSWDEVSIGYNAYSILTAARDEHGRFLPIDTFAAYGDYKPPLSIYLTVPSIAVFGLNSTGVRIPSAVFGILAVPLVYYLAGELFSGRKTARLVSIFAATILAISPWHIMLSRAGFEANIAFTFILAGITLLLSGRRHPTALLVAFVPFVLGMYTFNSARYAGPLIALSVLTIYREDFRKHWRYVAFGVGFGALILSPLVPHLISPEARLRFREVSIFNAQDVIVTANERITADGNTWWAKILHNRRLAYSRSYIGHFLDNLEPWFLFIRGDGNPKFSIQSMGQLYLFEAVLLALGWYWLFRYERRVAGLLAMVLLASIIPAASAVDTPHALRTENGLPSFLIPIAFALATIWNKTPPDSPVNPKAVTYWSRVAVICFYLFGVSYFSHQYFRHYATEYSGEWQYGYAEALEKIQPYVHEYDSIVMTESIGRPHMYVAFHTAYDPEAYRREIVGTFDAAGFYNATSLGKYHFTREGYTDRTDKTLFILDPDDVPEGYRIKDTVYLRNGLPRLVIFER